MCDITHLLYYLPPWHHIVITCIKSHMVA